MTNLDIMAQVLSEVTNQPPEHWRQIILYSVGPGGIDRQTKLLQTVEPIEAEQLLTKLRGEKQGILRWLVEGSVEAHGRLASE